MKKNKKNKSDDLKKMRERHNRLKERSENPGGGGEKRFDELKVGKNLRRVLPRVVNGKINPQFYTESLMHFKVGPNSWTVRCIGDKFIDPKTGRPTKGTPCPICKKFLKEQDRINNEYGRGSQEGTAEWRIAKEAYCPRVRYYFNVLDPDGNTKLHSCGDQIMEQLLGYFFEDDSDVGDFTALDAGSWLNFKRVGDGRNTKYKVYPGESSDLSDQWDSLTESLVDLEEARGELRTADDITDIMKGVRSENDASDDDSSDDGRTASDDDDDNEEEDSDEDDGDREDREEREHRSRILKSTTLSKKMKRMKRHKR
jgi:hypothetical protein